MFGFKHLYDRRSLITSSEDMEPTESGSMRKAAKAIGISEDPLGTLRKWKKTSLRTPMLRCFS